MTRIPHSEQAEILSRMARSKRTWLSDHGKDRPEYLREYESENLTALEQAAKDYRAAAERDRKEEMQQ